jgi:hypothetical protein
MKGLKNRIIATVIAVIVLCMLAVIFFVPERRSPSPPMVTNDPTFTSEPRSSAKNAETRRAWAKALEYKYLDETKIDTKLETDEENDTRLWFKWAGWDRVTVHQLKKAGLGATLKAEGFRKVIFYDGLGWSEEWDLLKTEGL